MGFLTCNIIEAVSFIKKSCNPELIMYNYPNPNSPDMKA